MNKLYLLFSATERVIRLESICRRLREIQAELELTIPSSQLKVQLSVMMETMTPIPEALSETDGLDGRKRMLENARHSFGTHLLGPEMNRLVSRNDTNESSYNFAMGIMSL